MQLFKKIKMLIFKSEFIGNVSIILSGSALSQIIPLLAAPVIARLYSPNDYAVLAAYSSISILLTIAATGSYHTALMLDVEDHVAINTASVAIAITLIITIISFIVMLFFREAIAELTANADVSFWLYFVPLTVFFTGANQTLGMWNNRKKRYKWLAFNRIILTFCTTSLTLLFGFVGFKEKGLLISAIAGQGIAFFIIFGQTIFIDNIFFYEISTNRLRQSFIKHLDFPKYNMPQAFFDGVRESSMLLIISNFFGASVLGSFSFATNIVMKPLSLLGGAVAQVFYEKSSNIFKQSGNIYNITKKTLITLTFFGLPFSLIILLGGKDIFNFVFGNKWQDAGLYSQILMPWLFLSFIASPLSTIPMIMNKQNQSFYYSIFSNFMPIIILFITGYIGILTMPALMYFSLSKSMCLIIVIYWFYNLSKKQPEAH